MRSLEYWSRSFWCLEGVGNALAAAGLNSPGLAVGFGIAMLLAYLFGRNATHTECSSG